MCYWYWQDLCMSMKILNFHYNYSRQNSFHCCNLIFVFVMGNQLLHIYVEAVIYINRELGSEMM